MARVIVVHGLFFVPFQFSVLVRALRQAGFMPSCPRYASTRQPAAASAHEIGDVLDRIRAAAGSGDAEGAGPVHFVGYSLGALALRSALAERPDYPAGRFVMIAPPNQGVGSLMRGMPDIGVRCSGPAFEDLQEGSDFVRTLPPPPPGSGIIAGDRPSTALHPSWWIRRHLDPSGPHDGTVELRNTRLPDVPHVTVHQSHTSICWNREVATLVRTFLETGRFPPAAAA